MFGGADFLHEYFIGDLIQVKRIIISFQPERTLAAFFVPLALYALSEGCNQIDIIYISLKFD